MARSPHLGVGNESLKRCTADWEHSHTGTQGLIFVIDSNDRSRIDEAGKELHKIILDREMKEARLLVFANKQDIQGGKKKKNIDYIPD